MCHWIRMQVAYNDHYYCGLPRLITYDLVDDHDLYLCVDSVDFYWCTVDCCCDFFANGCFSTVVTESLVAKELVRRQYFRLNF